MILMMLKFWEIEKEEAAIEDKMNTDFWRLQ
jgi:regulation of enolase protein 1 (concanavalin A-like superfamily)